MFSIGGSTGIILSTNVMNIALHDSYYVVSHFHMVLSLGAITSLLSGVSMLQDHLTSHISISNNTIVTSSLSYSLSTRAFEATITVNNMFLSSQVMLSVVIYHQVSIRIMNMFSVSDIQTNIFYSYICISGSVIDRLLLVRLCYVILSRSSYIMFYDSEISFISNTSISSRYHLLVTFIGI